MGVSRPRTGRRRPGWRRPDAVLTGPPELIIGLLAGRVDLATARSRGLRFKGDTAVLRRTGPVATGPCTNGLRSRNCLIHGAPLPRQQT